MRKFSKKIAMMMVLAMLVSMFSGIVSASAASIWSAKSVDDDNYAVVMGETIEVKKGEFINFDLFKGDEEATEAGYKYTWESSDADVLFINGAQGAKNGYARVKGEVGDEATITATFTNLTTGKSAERSFDVVVVEELEADVEVEEAEYTIETKVGEVELGEEVLGIGSEYTFTAKVLDADGEEVKDAAVKYTIDDKEIKFPYQPAAEGIITVVATATLKDEVLVETETEVVVINNNVFAADQVSMKSFKMTFDESKDASKIDKNDVYVGVSSKEDGTPVKTYVYAVKGEKNVLTVTLFNDLAKDSFVTVKYANESDMYKVVEGAVAKVVINTAKVKINESTELDIKLYNEQGVDITSPKLLANVTLSNLTKNVSVNVTGRKVMYWTKNVSADIQAIYHTYDYKTLGNGQEVVVKSEPVTITFVDEVTTLIDANKWTVATPNTADWQIAWNANNKVAVGDDGYQLIAEFTRIKSAASDNKDTVKSRDVASLTYSSSNPDVLYVGAKGILHPIKVGSADVIIKSGNDIIAVYPVEVVAKRVPTYVTVGNYKGFISKNENLTIPVTVYDQYDAKMNSDTAYGITVKEVSNNNANWGTYYTAWGSITIDKAKYSAVTTQKDYTLSIGCNNSSLAYVNFTVKAPKAAVASYAFNQASQEVKMSAADNANLTASKSVGIASFDDEGLLINNNATANITLKDNLNNRPTDQNFYVTVTANNDAAKGWVLKNWGQNVNTDIVSVTGSTVVLKTYEVVGDELKMAPAGTYTFTLYKGIPTEKVNNVQMYDYSWCGESSVVVIDEQKKYTAVLKNDTIALANAVSGGAIVAGDIAMIKEAYEFAYNGNDCSDAAEAVLVLEAPVCVAKVGQNVAYEKVTVVESFTIGGKTLKLKSIVDLGRVSLTVNNK